MSFHYTDYEELLELRERNENQRMSIKYFIGEVDSLRKQIEVLKEIIKNGNNNTKPKTTRKTTKREM